MNFENNFWQFLGSRTRLRTQNSSLGVILDAQEND